MANDKREGWLRELKPGNRVACDGWGMSRKELYVGTVQRITPAGTIFVDFGWAGGPDEFRSTGRRKADGSYDHHTLIQLTPEVEAEYAHAKAVNLVSSYLDFDKVDRKKVETMTLDQLAALYRVLKPLRQENNG